MKAFPPEVIAELKTYVYRLIDPRNGETFYVGKGVGNRVFAHVQDELKSDDPGDKLTIIADCEPESSRKFLLRRRPPKLGREFLGLPGDALGREPGVSSHQVVAPQFVEDCPLHAELGEGFEPIRLGGVEPATRVDEPEHSRTHEVIEGDVAW